MSNYMNLSGDQHQNLTRPTTDPSQIQTQMLSGMLPEIPSRQQRPAFKSNLAFKLSVVQIINGGIAVICGMTILVMRTYLYFTGIGIGSGAVFIAAGVLGLISAKNRAAWAIVSCLVLSVVSAVASGVTIIASSEGVYLNHHGHPFYEVNNPKLLRMGIAMDAVLIVSSLAEIVAAIFQATICCRVTCCTGAGRPEIMVVYIPQQMNAQNGSGSDMTSLPVPAPVVMYPASHISQYVPPSNNTDA